MTFESAQGILKLYCWQCVLIDNLWSRYLHFNGIFFFFKQEFPLEFHSFINIISWDQTSVYGVSYILPGFPWLTIWMASCVIYSKPSGDTNLLKSRLEQAFCTLFPDEWKNCKNSYPIWIDLNSVTVNNKVWWCSLIPVPWVNAAFSGYSLLNLFLLTLFPYRGVCSGSSEIWSGYTHGSWHLVSVSRFIWATGVSWPFFLLISLIKGG